MGAIMTPVNAARYAFGGVTRERLDALVDGWLLTCYKDDPQLIQVFRDRRFENYHDLLPWNGEFAGKLLTGGAYCYMLTGDSELKAEMLHIALDYADTIGEDGYGGCMPQSKRLSGWDSWGMYHCVLGLFKWYKLTGDKRLMNAALSVADYMAEVFLDTKSEIKKPYLPTEPGNTGVETSQAFMHAFLLLYRETEEPRYMQAAKAILEDFSLPYAGDYYRKALEGVPFYKMPKPRWESLHPVQGLAELYLLTEDRSYKEAFCNIWKSIIKTDVHNTGAFSTLEQAVGNPFAEGAIETCCVIAFACATIDYLRLTGDSRAADWLELMYFNAIMGYQHPGGHWFTYNTPMDGVRKSSYTDIVFQAREGAPDLNCCSANAARGLSNPAEWAFMQRGYMEMCVNWYAPVHAELMNGAWEIDIDSGYPAEPYAHIYIKSIDERQDTFYFRIPAWSRNTKFYVDDEEQDVRPGSYHKVKRDWSKGADIDIEFDFSLWQVTGEREKEGLVSLYRGPVLLARDDRFNDMPVEAARSTAIDPGGFRRIDLREGFPEPFAAFEFFTDEGEEVVLCDFATAGMAGTKYATWLKTSRPVRTVPALTEI